VSLRLYSILADDAFQLDAKALADRQNSSKSLPQLSIQVMDENVVKDAPIGWAVLPFDKIIEVCSLFVLLFSLLSFPSFI
jgi:hypothetical protein